MKGGRQRNNTVGESEGKNYKLRMSEKQKTREKKKKGNLWKERKGEERRTRRRNDRSSAGPDEQ